MSANVRRLALDIGPSMWAYILFQFVITLLLDWIWIGGARMPWMPGLLLSLCTTFTAQNVSLWRTLPVTRAEIDRARWWQAIAGPGLLLLVALLVLTMVRIWLGLQHAAWTDIGLLALAQISACVAFTGFTVVFPLAIQKWGRGGSVLLIPAVFFFQAIFFHMDIPFWRGINLRTALAGVDVAALTGALVLYGLAGHWPLPLTTSLWSMPGKERGLSRQAIPSSFRLRGWPILVWGGLPIFALIWGLMICVCLMMKWFLPKFHLNVSGWIFSVAALQVAVYGIATAMRTLRALPLSGGQLTCRLILFVLLVQVISLVIFRVVLQLAGEQALSPAIFLIPLAYSLVYLPFGLRFGFRILQFGLAFSFIFIIPVQILASNFDASPWIAIGSIAVMIVGSGWTHWEITHGYRAYRAQPLLPSGWSGFK